MKFLEDQTKVLFLIYVLNTTPTQFFFCQYTSGRFCQIKLGTSSSRCEIESHINYFAGYLFDFVIVTYSSLFVCQLMLVIFGDIYMK